MGWKTPSGRFLDVGDRVVWHSKGISYIEHVGTVTEALPVNDDDDGEIKIQWDSGSGPVFIDMIHGGPVDPKSPRINDPGVRPKLWYYPFDVEHIDDVDPLSRIVYETKTKPS